MSTSNAPDAGGAAVEELLDEPVAGRSVDAKDIEELIDTIRVSTAGTRWEVDVELDLGPKRWRPSAVSQDRARVLYVFLQDELPRFIVARLRLASSSGLALTVALPIAALFKPSVVKLLAEIEADVLVVDDYVETRRLKSRPLLLALAEVEVAISPELRRTISGSVWQRISEGTPQQRGRRLENLLAFLFSQVQDMKVIETNYRTETEEIDLVLQVDNFSPRVWQNPGVPFILVEAKNRADKATQQVMSVLLTKLQTKRGTTRIAFLISMAGFTEDAKLQELRFSTQEMCVVMIDRTQLEVLIHAENLDDALEALVRHALLR
jgi:Holliday junction resolvase-like predicted endonuclease